MTFWVLPSFPYLSTLKLQLEIAIKILEGLIYVRTPMNNRDYLFNYHGEALAVLEQARKGLTYEELANHVGVSVFLASVWPAVPTPPILKNLLPS